jgi:hypothetical protein
MPHLVTLSRCPPNPIPRLAAGPGRFLKGDRRGWMTKTYVIQLMSNTADASNVVDSDMIDVIVKNVVAAHA